MRLSLKPALALAIILLITLASLTAFLLPAAKPHAGNDEFSADRAMEHVEKIAAKTHPVGSLEQQEVRDYIIHTVTAMGFTPEIQTGHGENDAEGFMGFVPYSGQLENIYFRLEGSGGTGRGIVMMAHYDSTLGGPGTADDASGAAVLLETARALKTRAQLMNDIVFLFTDGEEANLLGSKLFAQEEDLLQNVGLVIYFESRGRTGPSILFETSGENGWLMQEYLKAVPYPVAYSFSTDVYKMVSNVTDFTPFKNAGKSGFNFSNLGGMETYHNPQDTPANLDRDFLAHQGGYALSLANHFGDIPLDQVKSGDNSVFFTLAGSVMVLYSENWNIPLTVFALTLLAAAVWMGLRKRFITRKGVVSGFFVSLLSLQGAVVLGIAAQLLFSGIFYKLDKVQSLSNLIDLRRTLIFHGNIWIIVTLILSAVMLFLLQRLFGKKMAGYDLLMGSMFTWSILALITALCMPGAGYMFLWPLVFTLAGILTDFALSKGNAPQYLVSFVLAASSCLLIYLPVGYLLYQALTMLGGAIPAALLSMPMGLIVLTASLFAGRLTKADSVIAN